MAGEFGCMSPTWDWTEEGTNKELGLGLSRCTLQTSDSISQVSEPMDAGGQQNSGFLHCGVIAIPLNRWDKALDFMIRELGL